MRVLYWTPLFWPSIGGIEVLSTRLLPALAARGHQLTVVTEGEGAPPGEETFRGVAVHRFPFAAALARRDLGEVVRIRRETAALKRRLCPDLVHLHHPGPI